MWYNFKKWFLRWFSDIRLYKGGIIFFGDSHYIIKGKETREILDIIQPGDVLLRRYDHYLGSILIQGYWSHAGIYVGNNSIIHMIGKGLTKDDILVFLRCDDIIVLRNQYKDKRKKAVETALKLYEENTCEYDYDFASGNKNFYCTEFVDSCYDYVVNVDGKGITLPDEFLNCKEFKIVWEMKKNI